MVSKEVIESRGIELILSRIDEVEGHEAAMKFLEQLSNEDLLLYVIKNMYIAVKDLKIMIPEEAYEGIIHDDVDNCFVCCDVLKETADSIQKR